MESKEQSRYTLSDDFTLDRQQLRAPGFKLSPHVSTKISYTSFRVELCLQKALRLKPNRASRSP